MQELGWLDFDLKSLKLFVEGMGHTKTLDRDVKAFVNRAPAYGHLLPEVEAIAKKDASAYNERIRQIQIRINDENARIAREGASTDQQYKNDWEQKVAEVEAYLRTLPPGGTLPPVPNTDTPRIRTTTNAPRIETRPYSASDKDDGKMAREVMVAIVGFSFFAVFFVIVFLGGFFGSMVDPHDAGPNNTVQAEIQGMIRGVIYGAIFFGAIVATFVFYVLWPNSKSPK